MFNIVPHDWKYKLQIDKKDVVVDEIEKLNKNLYVFRQWKKMNFVNAQWKQIFPHWIDAIKSDFINWFMMVQNDDWYNFIDEKWNILLPKFAAEVYAFNKYGFAIVSRHETENGFEWYVIINSLWEYERDSLVHEVVNSNYMWPLSGDFFTWINSIKTYDLTRSLWGVLYNINFNTRDAFMEKINLFNLYADEYINTPAPSLKQHLNISRFYFWPATWQVIIIKTLDTDQYKIISNQLIDILFDDIKNGIDNIVILSKKSFRWRKLYSLSWEKGKWIILVKR